MRIYNTDINVPPIRDSTPRRVLQLKNKIISNLKLIGVNPDDVDFSEEKLPMKRAEAWVDWIFNDSFCFCSYLQCKKYIENLAALEALIDFKVRQLTNKEIDEDSFTSLFEEDEDIIKIRKEARKFFDVEDDCFDFSVIDKKYKQLAKSAHPDAAGEDLTFQELNKHHKVLKKQFDV